MNTNLTAIVGSLRTASVNGAIARAASTTSDDIGVTIHDIADLPLYNGDIEAAGPNREVAALHDAVAATDGVLIFSPEYNSSFPAVTKNVIDWLSRPPKAWEGVPLGLVVATPGPRAGAGFRDHFTAMMERQPVRLFETLGIGSYGDKLDEHGELTDPEALGALADYVGRFAAFCRNGDT